MADHPNNHNRERTQTVALREEVERALGGTVPAKRKEEVLLKVGQIVDKYSSPYPDADWLSQVNLLEPGLVRDIVQSSIDDLKSRRQIEERTLDLKEKELNLVDSIATGERRSTSQGRYIGLTAYLAAYVFSAVSYYIGAHELAYLGFGAGSLGIVAQLIRGTGGSSAVTITASNVKKADKQRT